MPLHAVNLLAGISERFGSNETLSNVPSISKIPSDRSFDEFDLF